MTQMYMQVLHRVPNMSDYGSIHLNNALICINMPYCSSAYLNIAEYCLMSLNMPEMPKQTVMTMPGFSVCHYIVIITYCN